MPRVRKSDTEKKAQGTLQRCRIPKIPVSFSEKKLSAEPPKGLRQDAKDAWAMAIECSPYPLVAIDLSVLERWARNYAMYRRLAREVEDDFAVFPNRIPLRDPAQDFRLIFNKIAHHKKSG